MNNSWRKWLIDYTLPQVWTPEFNVPPHELPRSYSWVMVGRNEVPFDVELDAYIKSGFSNVEYLNNGYFVIKYEVGDYISEHTDYAGDNIATYVCELQASQCETGFMSGGVGYKEHWYGNTIKHGVDRIKSGTRISFSMFGMKATTLI